MLLPHSFFNTYIHLIILTTFTKVLILTGVKFCFLTWSVEGMKNSGKKYNTLTFASQYLWLLSHQVRASIIINNSTRSTTAQLKKCS